MKVFLACTFAALFLLSGCGSAPSSSTGSGSTVAPSAATLPPGVMLSAALTGAKEIIPAKKEAKSGDEIVLRGQVGGSAKGVFNEKFATFLLADMSLSRCDGKPGDNCPTPWDFCCDDNVLAKTATIEIHGADGKPLHGTLHGVSSLEHLAVVQVKGKVLKAGDGNLVVQASGIYVEKPGVAKKP